MTTALRQLEREIDRLKERIRREAAVEEVTVPGAAQLLKKTPLWVRANLPVIIHGKHSHHVRLADIEAYQSRRTLQPKLNGRTLK
jgi:hypothetical protein